MNGLNRHQSLIIEIQTASFRLIAIITTRNFATKDNVLIKVIEQHDGNEEANKYDHNHERARIGGGFVDSDFGGNDVRENY